MLQSIDEFRENVTIEIEALFDNEIAAAASTADFIPEHLTYLKELSLRGGKKLRGYLTYLGSHAYDSSDLNESTVLYLASSLEIFHSSILVVDDIMDQSAKRRGMETMHIYEQKKFGSSRIGESVAYCFGLAGLFLTNHLFASVALPSKTCLKLYALLNRVAIDLVYGQAYDMLSASEKAHDLTIEKILNIYNLKTGLYTFLLPLQVGILASGNEEQIESVKEFSRFAGIIYQLTDDLLDVFGDTALTGKESGCMDIRDGKTNTITILTLNRASFDDKEFLSQVIGSYQTNTFNEETIVKIQNIIMRSGALDETNKLIDFYTKSAIESLRAISINKEVREILIALILSLKKRQK